MVNTFTEQLAELDTSVANDEFAYLDSDEWTDVDEKFFNIAVSKNFLDNSYEMQGMCYRHYEECDC